MNPDVIYGRDFEDETIEIEKIDGPIGEVVIRGKILSVDTREISNEKTIIIFSITDFSILRLISCVKQKNIQNQAKKGCPRAGAA